MCAHLVTPSLGVLDTNYLPAERWEAEAAFRYYNSRQDVLGDMPLKHPITYANTHIYELDLGVTYAVTDRFDLTMDIPIQYGTRKTSIEQNFMSPTLHTMHAFGFGDMQLRGDFWLFDPKGCSDRNIALGLGARFPTGEDDLTDYSYRATGKIKRPVDPAIQPGTGGYGIILESHGYSSLFFKGLPSTSWLKNTYAYADGTYIVTPQEYNGVQSPTGDEPALTGGRKTAIIDSIPDEFLTRAGLEQMVLPSQGVAVSAGVRWEGVPGHDLIGGSSGWRLPGASLSFEPGISYTRGKNTFSVYVPIALYRVAYASAAFDHSPNPNPDLAAIADWQLIVTYTHQF